MTYDPELVHPDPDIEDLASTRESNDILTSLAAAAVVAEELRLADRRRNRIRDLVQSILIVILFGVLTWLSWQAFFEERDRKELTAGNRIILKNIEAQTSPEAVAEQEAALKEVIIILDCNNRAVTEEALNKIAEQRPELFDKVTLTDNCIATTTPSSIP